MHRSTSPWRSARDEDASKVLNTTKEQIQRQLAAITQLFGQHKEYLEQSEVAWIIHIIDSASAVVADTVDEEDYHIQPERVVPRNSMGLREKFSTRHIYSRSKELSPQPRQNQLKTLLAVARSLNSALHLLSCCQDRWNWLQSSQRANSSSTQTISQPPRILARGQVSNNRQSSSCELGPYSEARQDQNGAPASPTFSAASEESETQLSFFVIDTVEQWRRDAESALDDTTKRYQASTSGTRTRRDRVPSVTVDREIVNSPPALPVRPISRMTRPASESTYRREHRSSTSQSNGSNDLRLEATARVWSDTETRSSSSSLSHSYPSATPATQSESQPFPRSLQNSYEKEAVAIQTLHVPYMATHTSTDTIMDGTLPNSHVYSRSDVSLPNSYDASIRTRSESTNSQVHADNLSTTSVNVRVTSAEPGIKLEAGPQGDTSSARAMPRSRGRMWLEQQVRAELDRQRQSQEFIAV